jgi:hypothetical protein
VKGTVKVSNAGRFRKGDKRAREAGRRSGESRKKVPVDAASLRESLTREDGTFDWDGLVDWVRDRTLEFMLDPRTKGYEFGKMIGELRQLREISPDPQHDWTKSIQVRPDYQPADITELIEFYVTTPQGGEREKLERFERWTKMLRGKVRDLEARDLL